MEEMKVYVVFKDSNIQGCFDEEQWKAFNEHYKERTMINRFNVYLCTVNGTCLKLYWNVHRKQWEEDR